MTNDLWEFWIDVGGTFTDCLARSPLGMTSRLKTLSSGVVKGQIDRQQAGFVWDKSLVETPSDFWIGWKLKWLDREGHAFKEQHVVGFESQTGRLELDTAPPRLNFPQAYELDAGLDGPTVAIRLHTGVPLSECLPPMSIRLGTTRGTNALLTRRGARTAWVTTSGFADVLEIGYQSRPHLFELGINKPEPLYEAVVEIDERITATGEVITRPNREVVLRQLSALQADGIESVAIGFLHGYAFPDHEALVADVAREMGFADVSVSHEVAPLIKLVARGDTTVANAYLNPTLHEYIQQFQSGFIGEGQLLRLMTSSGGLVHPTAFEGKDSILSGPAGGVVGAACVATAIGRQHVIGFDMGGTSTDVSRFDGAFDYEYETEKAGVRIVTPMLSIETVAAGGGSICHFDGLKLCVGPQSAGAAPGPACYGRGGPLTVTDVNLFLGRLPDDALPFPLDDEAVRVRLEEIRARLSESDIDYSLHELATGFLAVANHNMSQAIRSISLAKGYDPRDYAMVAFGGAAPQHACAVARQLGIPEIVDPPDGALLSAVGIGLADETGHAQKGIYQKLDDCKPQLAKLFAELRNEALAKLPRHDISASDASDRISHRRLIELRYHGTDWPISLSATDLNQLEAAYHEAHERLYGYATPNRPIEVVAIRAEADLHPSSRLQASRSVTRSRGPSLGKDEDTSVEHKLHIDGCEVAARRYERHNLKPGDQLVGPAVVVQSVATTVIDPGWVGEVLSEGELLLRDKDTDARDDSTIQLSSDCDPVGLELFNGQFQSTAEQMGITLRNTSSSVNVKERLDFSCAIFTANGELVVNAPHIPVHLGAMSETVRCVLQDNPQLQAGDVIVTNDPFRGGSHLPDVTVITPVFDNEGEALRFFVASRAHHAEIGGIAPGSMPPFSNNLADEGVLIRNFKLLDRGESRFEQLSLLLSSAPYPSRDVASNLADVGAQVAANQQGVRDLRAMIEKHSWPIVDAYMHHIQRAAESRTRQALAQLPDRRFEFSDRLDSGETIQVAIDVQGDSATIDFTGTSDVHEGNLNANRAIVHAATLYAIRCLIDEDLPLNEGVLTPLTIKIPPGLLNPAGSDSPRDCPAVAGGNVETSQRIVDVLLGALQLAAASQGTMNNLLFGNDRFGYYETICGGTGATPGKRGADAVHSHMTNTRLTDIEILESRYPIRVERFAVRRGSGGNGEYRGGDGVIREIRFLEPLDLSIISQRRGDNPPYGLEGGGPGEVGENWLARRDSSQWQRLCERVQCEVAAGDRLLIKTPGGGGFGKPS